MSIDEITLRDVAITSGGRTLRGDIEVVPQGKGFAVRKVALVADEATVDITGQVTDLSGPVGELSIKAGALNFDELLAFMSDFAASAGTGVSRGASPPVARPGREGAGLAPAMNIALSLEADSAAMGGLSLQKLSGRARITPAGMALDPIRFNVFGGSYDGTLTLTLGETPAFGLNAALSGVDMGAATTFAGRPDTITGRLAGKIDLTGSGMDATSVIRSTRGTARVDITNGTVKRLGLVRTVLLATSGRSDSVAQSPGNVSDDEPFARLAATLAVANGSASTTDLRLESNDLLLTAAGVVRLDGTSINLAGDVRLSDKLSAQVGRDLVRYTQEQGRVTLPATITGSADNPQVRIDMASLARRAHHQSREGRSEGRHQERPGGVVRALRARPGLRQAESEHRRYQGIRSSSCVSRKLVHELLSEAPSQADARANEKHAGPVVGRRKRQHTDLRDDRQTPRDVDRGFESENRARRELPLGQRADGEIRRRIDCWTDRRQGRRPGGA